MNKIKVKFEKFLTVAAMIFARIGFALDVSGNKRAYRRLYAADCEELFRLSEIEGRDISSERRAFESLKKRWKD